MKFMNTLVLVLLSVALTGLAVPESDKLIGIYKKELTRFASQYQSDRLRAPQDHVAAMRNLETRYQQSGELKSLLAVREERERFVANPSASGMQLVTTPSGLRRLQESYVSKNAALHADYATKKETLRTKFLHAMENLQKELTRQGKIQAALSVMKEIEGVDSIGSQGNSEGTTSAPGPAPSPARRWGSILDADALGEILHGKIARWNSRSRQITILYDFSDAQQMGDWQGGEFDKTRGILRCEKTVAWAREHFSVILEVHCDMIYDGDSKRAGMVVGQALQAHLAGDDPLAATLFQTSKQHPISNFTRTNAGGTTSHRSEMIFQNGSVEWSVDKSRTRRAILQVPIPYPTYVGFGHMRAASGYDNISITGILSKKYVAHLKQQLR